MKGQAGKMRRDAIVIKTDGDDATVAVLREDACGSCAGRRFCGNARKVEIKVKNDIGAGCGDTVEIETPSKVLLGYAALLFLAPVFLAVFFYILLSSVNAVLSYVFAGVGFVLPYIVAFFIEKRSRISVPVIREVRFSAGAEGKKKQEWDQNLFCKKSENKFSGRKF